MSKQDEESVLIVADGDSSEDRTTPPGEVDEADNSSTESSPLVINGNGRGKCLRVTKSIGRVLLANLLLVLTIGSVVVGVIIGLPAREARNSLSDESYSLMVRLLGFPGELFIRMLQMLILPLIIFSLIAGLGSLEAKVAGSLGWKTVLYYFSTTILAIILGIILVVTIKPGGRGQEFECNNATSASHGDLDTLDSILDLFRNLFPNNLFTATFQQSETHYSYDNITDFKHCVDMESVNASNLTLCQDIKAYINDNGLDCSNATKYNKRSVELGTRGGMNILGIIVFTVAFAITLGRLGEEGQKVVQSIGILNEAIMKLVTLVMWTSPVGIASIIAGKLAEVESFSVLVEEIGLYMLTVLLGLLIHGCITLPLIYIVMTRSNPLKVVKAALQALLTAFGTSSSSATLPVTIQCLEQNFDADSRVTRFMLPVGATINMDGTALYEAVAAIFISQVEQVPATIDKIIIISITATLASIGAAGVPQAGFFTLVIVLVAVGLNPESAALILAVDWLLDRFRTTVNVLGDCYGVGIVQRYSRKQLGPPSPPIVTQPPKITTTLSTLEERACSPTYGSSNGAPCVSPTDSLMNDGSTSVLESGVDALTASPNHEDKTVRDEHRLQGPRDSADSTDRDETNL